MINNYYFQFQLPLDKEYKGRGNRNMGITGV